MGISIPTWWKLPNLGQTNLTGYFGNRSTAAGIGSKQLFLANPAESGLGRIQFAAFWITA